MSKNDVFGVLLEGYQKQGMELDRYKRRSSKIEDVFEIFSREYQRQGLELGGYKRFDMEVHTSSQAVSDMDYVSEAVFRVPSAYRVILLPSQEGVCASKAKGGMIELELDGSGSAVSVVLKCAFGLEYAYDNYYPACRWCSGVVRSIEAQRGDELLVRSKTAKILSAAVYGWVFKEVKRSEEPEKEEKQEEEGSEEDNVVPSTLWQRVCSILERNQKDENKR